MIDLLDLKFWSKQTQILSTRIYIIVVYEYIIREWYTVDDKIHKILCNWVNLIYLRVIFLIWILYKFQNVYGSW